MTSRRIRDKALSGRPDANLGRRRREERVKLANREEKMNDILVDVGEMNEVGNLIDA